MCIRDRYIYINGNKINAISCGYDYALAIDSTGGVHGIGNNIYGQYGTGVVTSSNSPYFSITMPLLSTVTVAAN